MIDVLIVVMLSIALYLGLPFAILLIRDRLGRPTRLQLEAASHRFRERLQNPDIAALEKHFGYPFPSALRSLYGNQEELVRGDFDVAATADATGADWRFIAYYLPADEESVKYPWPGLEKYFAFADDGLGNGYLVNPTDDDPPVFYHDHEEGALEEICEHLSEFMKWPRRSEET